MRLVTQLLCGLMCGAVAQFAATGTAGAQAYPTKPVRVVAPSSAGGPVDVITRAVMPGMAETLGQQIVIENRAGAAGLVGTDYVVKQAPDGYTLLFGFSGPLAIVPNLNPNTPYDPITDLVAITQVATAPYVLLVHPSVPAKNVKELIALAKAQPGQMNFSSGGNGTGIHMAGELFKVVANVRVLHVPYKGAAPAVTALMAGEVDMMFNGLPGAVAHIKSGKVRALAVGGATRSPLMPDTPTIAESGLEFKTGGWYGLLAPKGTSQAIVEKVNGALNRALNAPEMKERLTRLAVEGVSSTPEAFAKLIAEEKALWAGVIRKAGIKMQ
jgi:tripartite-type tricarboxylate transporter receptor subunit TctC